MNITQTLEKDVLDYGFVKLLNLSGPSRRFPSGEQVFDADDVDPAQVARISFDNFEQDRTLEQDERLYEYLLSNGHNTPVEMIETWWHMKMPIFVARQFVRHRTACINEVSARYAKLPDEWYVPAPQFVGVKSKSNKQGRSLDGDEETLQIAEEFCGMLDLTCSESYGEYLFWLAHGIAPELARCFLHVNHYTHWIWKMDLSNLMHFMSLRCHSHAQWEAQQYGDAVYELLKQFLPKSMQLFDEYKRKATPQELTHLQEALLLLDYNAAQFDEPGEAMQTVRKFFKRLGVK
jgi:thymidylate synthase (FAD)